MSKLFIMEFILLSFLFFSIMLFLFIICHQNSNSNVHSIIKKYSKNHDLNLLEERVRFVIQNQLLGNGTSLIVLDLHDFGALKVKTKGDKYLFVDYYHLSNFCEKNRQLLSEPLPYKKDVVEKISAFKTEYSYPSRN